jgi:hypothetical protein
MEFVLMIKICHLFYARPVSFGYPCCLKSPEYILGSSFCPSEFFLNAARRHHL